MPKEIVLPSLAADFEGGVIEEWHKQVGDRIDVGDVIAEVSTDKAVVDLEAEDAGTLGKILAPAGEDEVAVGTPIAILLLEGESDDDLQNFVSGGPVATAPASGAAPTVAASTSPSAATTATVDTDQGDRLFASPVAMRIANQLGVDLATIEGSGPGGRIVLGDVEAAAARQGAEPAIAGHATVETAIERPPDGTYTEVPLDKVRRVIARRLGEAKRDIPHFYLTIDCALDALLDQRAKLNASSDDAGKVSVNDFLIKACALALRDVPEVNTGWGGDAVLQFRDVNVAVAVATDKGLVTPVIREADSKSLAAIAAEMRELAGRARQGRLKPEEYKGGGFTLSNLGMYGIREFSAIINPPQSCILAVGAAEQRAVVRGGAPAVATIMSCTLSVDHRAVDGALGARFLQSLKSYVETPGELN